MSENSDPQRSDSPAAAPHGGRHEGADAPDADAPENARYPLAPALYIDDVDTLKAFADPLRLRILRALYDHGEGRALSAKQIRTLLHEEGNNRLYYHVRLLEDAGLIRKAFERKSRNLIEVFYVPVAKRLQIAPDLLSRRGPMGDPASLSPLVEMATAYLGALHADLRLIGQAEPAEVLLAHRVFSLTAAESAQMRAEFEALLERYEHLPISPGARQHRVTTMAYPSDEPGDPSAP